MKTFRFHERIEKAEAQMFTPIGHGLQIATLESVLISTVVFANDDLASFLLDSFKCGTVRISYPRVPYRGSIFCRWTHKSRIDGHKIISW